MAEEQIIIRRLSRALQLTNDLTDGLGDGHLVLRNGLRKSNMLGEQFWCIVGARESYAKAIEKAKWQGFSCSLGVSDINSVTSLRDALARSKELIVGTLNNLGKLVDAQVEFVIDLLEHEAQHHGQLIRFFYANDIPFPQKFAERYAL